MHLTTEQQSSDFNRTAEQRLCHAGFSNTAEGEVEVPSEVLAQGCLLPGDIRQPLQPRPG